MSGARFVTLTVARQARPTLNENWSSVRASGPVKRTRNSGWGWRECRPPRGYPSEIPPSGLTRPKRLFREALQEARGCGETILELSPADRQGCDGCVEVGTSPGRSTSSPLEADAFPRTRHKSRAWPGLCWIGFRLICSQLVLLPLEVRRGLNFCQPSTPTCRSPQTITSVYWENKWSGLNKLGTSQMYPFLFGWDDASPLSKQRSLSWLS